MFDVWKNILEEIKNKTSREKFNTFLQKTSLISTNNGEIKIGVPNGFMQTNVRKNFDEYIREALEHNGIEVKSTEYVISDDNNKIKKRGPREISSISETEISAAKRPYISNSPTNKHSETGLVSDYTFDNFTVGTNNELAAYAAKAVVDEPGKKRNPFFLYGKSGVGKTHLIQAIGNEIVKKHPKLKVLYVPVSRFYSDYIEGIKTKKVENFEKKYGHLDVLIVDDFQMIIGKEKSQEEFFNIFNEMYLSKRQVIVTSDRLPDEIKELDVRLSSRLIQDGAYDIQLPSFEDKCAILAAKAEFNGVQIEREAIEYIADNVKTNVRDLNSEYEKLVALAELRGVTPLQIINDGLVRPGPSSQRNSTTPRKIIDKTAKFYEMDVKTMLSKSRVANIKNARQVAMYLMRNELGLSQPKIARELGLKDHTTVINGLKRIDKDMKLNFKLREDINTLRERVYE